MDRSVYHQQMVDQIAQWLKTELFTINSPSELRMRLAFKISEQISPEMKLKLVECLQSALMDHCLLNDPQAAAGIQHNVNNIPNNLASHQNQQVTNQLNLQQQLQMQHLQAQLQTQNPAQIMQQQNQNLQFQQNTQSLLNQMKNLQAQQLIPSPQNPNPTQQQQQSPVNNPEQHQHLSAKDVTPITKVPNAKYKRKLKEAEQVEEAKPQKTAEGPWTADEHQRFCDAVRAYGKNWEKVVEHVGTRNRQQVSNRKTNIVNQAKKDPTVDFKDVADIIDGTKQCNNNNAGGNSAQQNNEQQSKNEGVGQEQTPQVTMMQMMMLQQQHQQQQLELIQGDSNPGQIQNDIIQSDMNLPHQNILKNLNLQQNPNATTTAPDTDQVMQETIDTPN